MSFSEQFLGCIIILNSAADVNILQFEYKFQFLGFNSTILYLNLLRRLILKDWSIYAVIGMTKVCSSPKHWLLLQGRVHVHTCTWFCDFVNAKIREWLV
jgi:hypothetical protein